MPDDNLTGPSAAAPGAEGQQPVGSKVTAAKFRALIDMLDTYMQHSHNFNDDYGTNCQCQCGRGSI